MATYSNPPDLSSHLAAVLGRATTLVPPLRAFAEELPAGRQRRQLARVLRILERNDATEATTTLATLPEYWIPLLSAASTSQDPERVLRQFLDESSRAAELQRQKWQAIAYPLCIIGLAGVVFSFLSFAVIPVFRKMFQEFALKIPVPTASLLTVAEWITNGRAFVVILASGALIWLAGRAVRWLPSSLRETLENLLPSPLGRATAVARFTQFTADLLEARLEIPSALRVAGLCSRSGRLRAAAAKLAEEVERNTTPVSQDLGGPLTHTVVFALTGGLSEAARIRVLREVSASYSQVARVRLSWTRGVFEPLAVVVLGVVVGWTVLALFMPLISLVNALS